MRPWRLVLSGLVAAVIAGPAAAHHSVSGQFDETKPMELTGTISKIDWINPHIYIHLEAPDPKTGKLREWTIECANTSILNRLGWKWNMIKQGDQISTVIAPLRTGEPAGLLKQVKIADGKIFGNGTPAGPPNISIETGKLLAAL